MLLACRVRSRIVDERGVGGVTNAPRGPECKAAVRNDRVVPDANGPAEQVGPRFRRDTMCFWQYVYVYNPYTGMYEYEYRWICR